MRKNKCHIFCIKVQVEIYFQLKELEERSVVLREGDYCKFGDKFYELLSLIQDQPTFGQIEQQIEVKARCRMAREGQFNINDEPKLQV